MDSIPKKKIFIDIGICIDDDKKNTNKSTRTHIFTTDQEHKYVNQKKKRTYPSPSHGILIAFNFQSPNRSAKKI